MERVKQGAVLALLLCACGGGTTHDAGTSVSTVPLAGTFTELAGVQPLTWPPLDPQGQMDPPLSGGLIADLDGDGRAEVLITQYRPSNATLVYSYDGVQLVRNTTVSLPELYDAVAAAMDVDGDGNVDLLTSSSVLWGAGKGAFVPGQLPGQVDGISALWDVDNNGLVDLVVVSYCTPPVVLLQMAPRQFVRATNIVAPPANINANAGFVGVVDGRMLLGTIGFACGSDGSLDVPNFYARGGTSFATVDLVPGLSFSNGAAMGATTGADLDGDGHLDLFVALNPQHVLISNGKQTKQTFYDVVSPTGKSMIPWSTLFLDLDYDGRTDALFTHGADSLYSDQVRGIGKQRTTAHRNGDHGFERFTSLGDLDRLGDWRILGVGDLDGDGDADLVVGGFGEDPHVYRNDTVGNGVSLRLLNRQGVPAYGADLVLVAGTTQHLQVAGIATQRQISEPLVFAGLGSATTGQLTITWASGATQVETVQAGRLTTIRESN